MASLRHARRSLCCQPRATASDLLLQTLGWRLQGLHIAQNARSRRCLSTDSPGPGEAGPSEAEIATLMQPLQLSQHARPVPTSPSYFSRQSRFADTYILLQGFHRKYGKLPKANPDDLPPVAWMARDEYRQNMGEPIKATEYKKCLQLVKELFLVHRSLLPETVLEALEPFKHHFQSFDNVANPIVVDQHGRAIGVGRRKSSTARAWVVEGTGEVLVNGKSLSEAFGRVHDRESAVWALRATQRIDKYNVWALVDGGGTTGQAEALTLAVAKGLLAHEPELKTVLRRAGCITRDRRKVERKKHGHVKARKSPAWVKR